MEAQVFNITMFRLPSLLARQLQSSRSMQAPKYLVAYLLAFSLLGGSACLDTKAQDDEVEYDSDGEKSSGSNFEEVGLEECPYPRYDFDFFNEPEVSPSDYLTWDYTAANLSSQQAITQRRIENAFELTKHSFADRNVWGTWFLDGAGHKKYFNLYLAPPDRPVKEFVVFIPNHSTPVALFKDNEANEFANTELTRCWVPR